MAAVITELKRDLPIPFGVDILWDPRAAIGLAHAVGARFVREVFTGAYASDFGIWNTDPAATLGYRRSIDAGDVRLFFNVTAEFAAPLGWREIGLAARSAVFSSLADAVCVSGAVTGTGAAFADLVAAKDAVGPGIAVIANTGVRPSTVGDILAAVDACIVGTSLKHDGITWNSVDRDRVDALLEAAEASGSWYPSNASRLVATPAESRGGA
jgi:membrane complex biogenesis BtpA family protein